eukprot:92469_1
MAFGGWAVEKSKEIQNVNNDRCTQPHRDNNNQRLFLHDHQSTPLSQLSRGIMKLPDTEPNPPQYYLNQYQNQYPATALHKRHISRNKLNNNIIKSRINDDDIPYEALLQSRTINNPKADIHHRHMNKQIKNHNIEPFDSNNEQFDRNNNNNGNCNSFKPQVLQPGAMRHHQHHTYKNNNNNNVNIEQISSKLYADEGR